MGYYIGIDLGGTNSKIGVLSEDNSLITTVHIKTNSDIGAENCLKNIWNTILQLIAEKNIEVSQIKGIGIGIPGPVVNQEVVRFFANFTWERDLNIAKLMENISGIKTVVDNDVNVIALGETVFGAGKGFSKSVTIALGTGIGGGIFIDGKLISGATGVGGEIGHMKVEKDGKLCGCGQYGCFEAYASATGIIREAVSRLAVNKNNALYRKFQGDYSKLEAKDIFDEARGGDIFSEEIVKYAAEYLALGIGNILNIINPEIVILAGGVALAGDILLTPIKNRLKEYTLESALEGLEIKIGELGNDAGVLGAALLSKN